jgi:hypothetical protein
MAETSQVIFSSAEVKAADQQAPAGSSGTGPIADPSGHRAPSVLWVCGVPLLLVALFGGGIALRRRSRRAAAGNPDDEPAAEDD